MARLHIHRIREDAAQDDGARILVDRLWPRGVSKDHAALDHWFKGVAPSDELRKWFGHDPEKFDRFAERYREELDEDASGEVAELKRCCGTWTPRPCSTTPRTRNTTTPWCSWTGCAITAVGSETS